MASYDYDIGIIGSGAAGLTVAAGTAQLGAKTLLVEREPLLGGDCLHYGCVPSKTLIKTAKVYHQMKNAAKYGLPGVDPGPVDFREIAGRISSVIETIQPHDSPERFCGLGAAVEFGHARFTDEHQIELDGRKISAGKWVVATGSGPAIPPFEGANEVDLLTNMEIFSLEELPRELIVVGAGPIAIEMAQAFCRLGSKVTVIQRSGQILSKEDKDMADGVQQVMESEGVAFELNATVKKFSQDGSTKTVSFEREGKLESVSGTDILVALGRKIAVDDMGLENAGVEFDKKGIKVNDKMRTNQSHIYACGDVTGKYLFTHAAGYEGGIVVTNAVMHLPKKADYTWFPNCTYCEPELAAIGMNETEAEAAGIETRVFVEEFGENDRALAEGEPTGKIKLVLDKHEKILGVTILGPSAGDLLSEWVAVTGGGVKLSTLAGLVHPYPTLGEINKRVAGDVYSPKIFSDTVKKVLGFLFGFKGRACRMQEGEPVNED